VCQVVAKALRVAPSSVSVKRGHASRDKVLAIEEIDATELQLRLANP
jgi:uncharacterized protein YggU (UPF0235/DUF167 family)